MAWSFSILGAFAFLMLWVGGRKSWPLWLRICSMVLVLAGAGVALYLLRDPQFLGSKQWFDDSPFRELILLALMIAGMVARSLSKAIEQRRKKIEKMRKNGSTDAKPGLDLDFWDMTYPFLLAFPTFGGLLGQLDSEVLDLACLVLAFESGFMWQTLLKSK